MRVLLISTTNSMVVRRGAINKDIRHWPLPCLQSIAPQQFGTHIDYLADFAGTPRYSYNVGLLALAAWLRQEMGDKVEVQYLDLFGEAVMGKSRVLCYPEHEYPNGDILVVHGLTERGLYRRLSQLQPDVVGVNCFTTAHHCDAVMTCQRVRKWATARDKNVSIVVGGVHPSHLHRYFAELPGVDAVVRGEGELTFAELLGCLRRGIEPSGVDGLTYWSHTKGRAARNGDRPPKLEVRKLPWIARDLVPRKRGRNTLYLYDFWHQGGAGVPFDVIVRSRGCPYAGRGCRHCASGKLFGDCRARDTRDCLDEVESLADRGVKIISDETDQVLHPPAHFKDFCRGLIERRLHERVRFITPNGLHIGLMEELGEDGRRLMVEAGYTDLCFALEGSQSYIQDVLNKNIQAESIFPICQSLRRIEKKLEQRIIIRVYVMLDGPGATKKMTEDTFLLSERLARQCLADQVIPFIATPIVGSAFFEEAMSSFVQRILDDFDAIYLPKLIPEGALEHRREEIIRRLQIDSTDRAILYDIFHEFRVWPAFRYGLGRVQQMFGVDGEYLEAVAKRIHGLTGGEQFRIG